VQRILEMVGVEGRSIRAVRRALGTEGLPTPVGKRHWSQMTVRAMILDNVYKPHTREELEALVPVEVFGRLDPAERYGVFWHNTRKNTYTPVVDTGPNGERRYRKRRKVTQRPREEWIGVPVPDSEIPREWVDKARETVKDNRRAPSRNRRFWELSGGMLRCALCGSKIRGHFSHGRGGPEPMYFYYRCGERWDSGACSHSKQHRAEDTEGRVWELIRSLMLEPQDILAGLERMIEKEREAASRGNPEAEAKAWLEELAMIEVERKGWLRHAARGKMSDAELDEELAALEEMRRTAEAELRKIEARMETVAQLERDLDAMRERYANMSAETLDSLTSEERHQLYGMLGLGATITMDGTLEVSGTFSGEGDALCGTKVRFSTP
jgi:site-specific DNA recombinase